MKCSMIIDGEFTRILQKWLTNAQVVKCENHGEFFLLFSLVLALQNYFYLGCSMIKHWVKTHGGGREDCQIYVADFRYWS